MDSRSVGITIANLRKQLGLTQLQLAQRLNVSDKAISRWESGAGFPEITQFPELAKVFGVTVDFLMTGKRRGIAIAGNILSDVVKTVDCYPKIGMLANILEISRAVGGCVPNTAIDLAKIDHSIPISAIGKIGDDEYGRFVLSQMSRYGIDCEQVSVSDDKPTSFSDVMSLPSGERTFFHARGANAQFSPKDINLSALGCELFHIGYILLLDQFDSEDQEYGTVMARFLHDARETGIKTSVDVVSDSKSDYKAKILPVLPYCDYFIVNEIESSMISDLAPYKDDGSICTENIEKTMRFIADAGVKEKIVIHCKEAGFCYDVATKNFTAVPSLKIPPEKIKGSVGAGDAFCAGCLYGFYSGYDDRHVLEFASAAAACNLFAENSVDGMTDRDGIEKTAKKYGRKTL